ncbi:MAG TPA: M20/M25/M40 family metallo-hydrolase [Gemmatimonadaceae bacterium]|nr:M20/M25/M40 family metallo-hydrolase [Gemmatimonadaceae bacterium]
MFVHRPSISTALRTVCLAAARAALGFSVAALPACRPASAGPDPTAAYPDPGALRRDIAYLASDALQGRGTGTPGNDSAAAFIARRYAQLGLQPLAPGYLQPFVAHSLATVHAGQPADLATQNVAALLQGRDASLRGQYVVVGAHFDHLGRSTEGALDPDAKDAIRPGADDNASGTAAVLELARLLAASPPRRSVLFVNFSAEEMGLLGSQYFVDHAPVPLDSIVAMVNFDMVGRLRDDKLIVYGVATASELPALVDSANARSGRDGGPWDEALRITALGDGFGPSDQSSFYARDIPVLHFFTDLHDDYHKASDVTSRINAAGEAQVVDVAEHAIRAIADRPARLTFVGRATPRVQTRR